jgi:heme/copper-type cytochrome/quinol oxidase subunit 1
LARDSYRDTTGDPWDGRTLEWTVGSPAPEHTFTPMPVIREYDAYWYAKLRGETLPTTKEHHAVPIARDSILPLFIAASLGVLAICLIYHLFIWAFIPGAMVFVLFIIRSFTDERKDFYGKEVSSE